MGRQINTQFDKNLNGQMKRYIARQRNRDINRLIDKEKG